MDALDKHVIKTALATLNAAGSIGIAKKSLLQQIDLAAGTPTTTEQCENCFVFMRDRGWIAFHFEPIWHGERWTITERGLTALEGM